MTEDQEFQMLSLESLPVLIKSKEHCSETEREQVT